MKEPLQEDQAIRAMAFIARVGPDLMLNQNEYVDTTSAALELARHPALGPGVWVRYKDREQLHRFVPMSNIRAIDVVGGDHPTWEKKT